MRHAPTAWICLCIYKILETRYCFVFFAFEKRFCLLFFFLFHYLFSHLFHLFFFLFFALLFFLFFTLFLFLFVFFRFLSLFRLFLALLALRFSLAPRDNVNRCRKGSRCRFFQTCR